MTKYFCILLLFISLNAAAQLSVHNVDSEPLIFGVRQIEKAIQKKTASQKVIVSKKEQDADVIVRVESGHPGLINGGYSIKRQDKSIMITANDEAGAMNGMLEIAEHLAAGKKLQDFKDKLYNPRLSVRAVKFNLPWSPYRTGKVMEQH